MSIVCNIPAQVYSRISWCLLTLGLMDRVAPLARQTTAAALKRFPTLHSCQTLSCSVFLVSVYCVVSCSLCSTLQSVLLHQREAFNGRMSLVGLDNVLPPRHRGCPLQNKHCKPEYFISCLELLQNPILFIFKQDLTKMRTVEIQDMDVYYNFSFFHTSHITPVSYFIYEKRREHYLCGVP